MNRHAAKYSALYPDDDAEKIARMAKQAVDARFVDGGTGLFAGAAGTTDPGAAGAELGAFHYFREDIEGRASFAWLTNSAADDSFLGVNLGARVQTPSRVAPFAGLGVFGGYSEFSEVADSDGIDNDDNGFIDERGEEKESVDGALGAVYPELGVHFWLTSHIRLTAAASYYVTTKGRDYDHWMYGVSLGYLGR
ncbi:MAG: hypothetical protein MPJ50_01825 [Pirellulales bacterium]|nr:hypothetical protein [Pirellulales bacterium]